MQLLQFGARGGCLQVQNQISLFTNTDSLCRLTIQNVVHAHTNTQTLLTLSKEQYFGA